MAACALLLSGACSARVPPPPLPAPTAPAVATPVEHVQVGSSRKASDSELALVQQLMRETEALRGLRFSSEVRVTIEDRAAMRAYVTREIDDEQLRRATRRYLALGAITPDIDVRALLIAVMDEELIGYYDPKEKRLAVRNDIARALGASAGPVETPRDERSLTWRATVVHELVHALQDQHFGLGDSIEKLRTTDADNAFGALVEGDATLAMLGYVAGQHGSSLAAVVEHPEQILSAMARTPEQLTGALRKAPALLREPLLFRYREGAHFCAELYRAGGWAKVDRAHEKPPLTTTSVRHPRIYLKDDALPALPAPDVEALLERDYQRVDDDVLGALELSVLLAGAPHEAQHVVDAWRGDHYVVLERSGTLSSVWWLRLSAAHVAKDVVQAFDALGDASRQVSRHGALLLVTRGLAADERADVEAWFQHADGAARTP